MTDTIEWNKHFFHSNFQGFVDATFADNKTYLLKQGTACSQLRKHAALTTHAHYDGIMICPELSHYLDNQTLSTQQFWYTLSVNDLCAMTLREFKGYSAINVVFNINKALQANNILSIIEHLSQIMAPNGIRVRLILEDIYAAPLDTLLSTLIHTVLAGVERITLFDNNNEFTETGVKNLIRLIFSELPQQDLGKTKLEFACCSPPKQALKNAVVAINEGIHFIHTSDSLFPPASSNVKLQSLLSQYSTHEVPINIHQLQQQGKCSDPIKSDTASQLPQASQSHQISQPAIEPPPQSNFLADVTKSEELSNLRMIFEVSADNWHVTLRINIGNRSINLEERVHHYVLLLLAREYFSQYQMLLENNRDIDPVSLGWTDREMLREMIGDNEALLNVKICRAKKQITDALKYEGIFGYSPITTRKGSIRLACGNVTIVRGSKTESEIKQWHPITRDKSTWDGSVSNNCA